MPFINTTLEVFFDAAVSLSDEEMRAGIDHSPRARNAVVPLLSGRAVTEVFFFGGRRGSGKTYAAGVFVEQLLRCNLQVVIVDVVGNWWGLRVGADGDPSHGMKIPVIGGTHGDIDVLAEGGAAVAQMLVDTGSSAVLDLSNLRKGARQRFLTDWAEEFFHRKKTDQSVVHVVLEEAHTIIPQRVMKGQERMLGAMEDLVRLGRNYGIGVSMLDQRPQSVHKDVLNQAEVFLAFQLTGAQERDAVRRWAEAKELPEVKAALADLARLPQGQCILWSPVWLGRCQKVDVGKKVTFDGSATPAVGAQVGAKKMRPIDLVALKDAMDKAAKVKTPASASSPAVKARVERQQQDDHLDAVNAVTDAITNGIPMEMTAAVITLAAKDARIAELEDESHKLASMIQAAFIGGGKAFESGESLTSCPFAYNTRGHQWWSVGYEYALRLRRAIEAEQKLEAASDKLARIGAVFEGMNFEPRLSTPGAPNGVHRALTVTPEQLASDQTYKTYVPTGTDADADIIGKPLADRLRKRPKVPNGAWDVVTKVTPVPVDFALKHIAVESDPGRQTVFVAMNPSSADATDDATIRIASAQRELAKFFGGTPDPEATSMIRAFLSVLYQRGPMNQAQILTRANYAKSGPTNKAFAVMKAKGWVIAGNFGTGTTQLSLTGAGARAMGSFEPVELPTLSVMERAFLSALATRGALTQKQILTQTGYSKSGPTNKVFAKFKRNAWVSGEDVGIAITDWGREVLGTFDKRVVGKAFAHALIAGREGKLSQMERSFLAVLHVKGSEGMLQKDVLADAQYAKSGPTNKAFAHLVSLGYCRRTNGRIACSDDLYD